MMTPSIKVAGVTSKHGFHTYQQQTQVKPTDKANVKVCSSVSAMAAAGLYLVLHACIHYLVTSPDWQRCSQTTGDCLCDCMLNTSFEVSRQKHTGMQEVR